MAEILSTYMEGICTLFLFSLISYLMSILVTSYLENKKKDGKEEKEEKEESMKINKEYQPTGAWDMGYSLIACNPPLPA